jgi:hypothetical protein
MFLKTFLIDCWSCNGCGGLASSGQGETLEMKAYNELNGTFVFGGTTATGE